MGESVQGTGNCIPGFCEAKRVPFLAQVLSLERKCNLKVVEIPITVRYGIGGTSSKNPVSHEVGVLG